MDLIEEGHALEQVGLSDRAKDRVSKLSGGLKRRLNLAVGLTHTPDLLLLDEPTVGIDPQARLRILDVVQGQARAGRAVLYTSHYLEEAEQICDRLAIIDNGKIVALDTPSALRERCQVDGKPASLEDVFMQLTGRSLEDADEGEGDDAGKED